MEVLENRARQVIHMVVQPILEQINSERNSRAKLEVTNDGLNKRIKALEDLFKISSSAHKPPYLDKLENEMVDLQASQKSEHLVMRSTLETNMEQQEVIRNQSKSMQSRFTFIEQTLDR